MPASRIGGVRGSSLFEVGQRIPAYGVAPTGEGATEPQLNGETAVLEVEGQVRVKAKVESAQPEMKVGLKQAAPTAPAVANATGRRARVR
jgi:hypothetical protein